MAEFNRELIGLRKQLCEVPEESDVGVQIGRDLKKDWAKLAGLSHWFHAPQKAAKRIGNIFQPTKVRDHLMRFGGKAEIRRGAGNPILEQWRGSEPAKRDVELHCIQLRGIKFQKFLLRELVRKKGRLPCRIGPARGANIQRHGRSITTAKIAKIAVIAKIARTENKKQIPRQNSTARNAKIK